MNYRRVQGPTSSDNNPKWFNSPVFYHEGTLSEISPHIPEFERRPFALTQSGEKHTRINERLDTIVRKPTEDDPNFLPIGVVSKEYVLVPHSEVVNIAAQALATVKISPADVKTELKITAYGERMSLSLYFPKQYSFDPGDGNPMSLRLECFNSVDGSTRFRALMGWFRLVCSNGLIIGVTRSDLRRRHIGDIGISDIEMVLISGIKESKKEMENFKKWRQRGVHLERLKQWVNDELRKGWGFKAAARAFNISQSGHDAYILGPYKNNTPLTIPVFRASRVPGTPLRSDNLYDVSQILAWLAKERRDVQEQLEWREKIPELLKPLMN